MLFYVHPVADGIVTVSVQQAEDYTLVKLYKTSEEVDNFTAFELFDEILVDCSDELFDTDGFEAHYRVTLRKLEHPEEVKLFLRYEKGLSVSHEYAGLGNSPRA